MKGVLGFIKKIALQLAGAAPVANLVSVLYPKSTSVVNTFNQVVDLVKQTEGIATAIDSDVTGEQKLTAITPFAVAAIRDSEALVGHNIIDETGFVDGVKMVVSGVVKILHSVQYPNQPPTV